MTVLQRGLDPSRFLVQGVQVHLLVARPRFRLLYVRHMEEFFIGFDPDALGLGVGAVRGDCRLVLDAGQVRLCGATRQGERHSAAGGRAPRHVTSPDTQRAGHTAIQQTTADTHWTVQFWTDQF